MLIVRVEFFGGKISFLDRMEEDRKRRVEIVVSVVER